MIRDPATGDFQMTSSPFTGNAKRSAWALAAACITASCMAIEQSVPYTEAELHRKVVSRDTGEGLADAIVVFTWKRTQPDFETKRDYCVHVEMLRTGVDGRYSIPEWRGKKPSIAAIYKRGYARQPDPIARKEGVDLMGPSVGGTTQRFTELNRTMVRCDDDEDRRLLVFYQALFEEAKSIATTEAENRWVNKFFLQAIESAQLDNDEATRRARARAAP
jgi:hypothetical protein